MAHANKKTNPQIGGFSVAVEWPERPTTGGDAVLDASVGRLLMSIEDAPITAHKSDSGGDAGNELTIPLYGMTEWIAANWWPLLFEPGKTDRAWEEDEEYLTRHWLGFAREGIALPDLWLVPEGDSIKLSAREAYLRFARLTFTEGRDASVPRDVVSATLRKFVDEVLAKLTASGRSQTDAHDAWRFVVETTPEEALFCRLVGSLGLSPYEKHHDVEDVLEKLSRHLDERVIVDVCDAATPSSLESLSKRGTEIIEALPSAPTFDLSSVAGLTPASDHSPQAWRWGVESATRVRTHLGISDFDPEGGKRFFENLDADLDLPPVISAESVDGSHIDAGLSRDGVTARIALADTPRPQRRFAAARSAFLGWVAQKHTTRLITNAKTREQQASRAFAAEMLAPISFIRKNTGGYGISSYRIDELAEELDVLSSVVRFQAQNNALGIQEYY